MGKPEPGQPGRTISMTVSREDPAVIVVLGEITCGDVIYSHETKLSPDSKPDPNGPSYGEMNPMQIIALEKPAFDAWAAGLPV